MPAAPPTAARATELSTIPIRRTSDSHQVVATVAAGEAAAGGHARRAFGWAEDAGLLLLLVVAFPVAIIAAGIPVALVVRLLIEIGRRL